MFASWCCVLVLSLSVFESETNRRYLPLLFTADLSLGRLSVTLLILYSGRFGQVHQGWPTVRTVPWQAVAAKRVYYVPLTLSFGLE
jgi:hypothetical protein